jgi:hypothetical protein
MLVSVVENCSTGTKKIDRANLTVPSTIRGARGD